VRGGLAIGKVWRLDAFVNNITNREAATTCPRLPGDQPQSRLLHRATRTIGLEFNYSFKVIGVAIVTAGKGLVLGWVDRHAAQLSAWHQLIWHYAETCAFASTSPAAWYVRTLQDAGFDVEVGSGGNADRVSSATFRPRRRARRSATYAEYERGPGQCQAATPHAGPRAGLFRHAGPATPIRTSALGIQRPRRRARATKAAMQETGPSAER